MKEDEKISGIQKMKSQEEDPKCKRRKEERVPICRLSSMWPTKSHTHDPVPRPMSHKLPKTRHVPSPTKSLNPPIPLLDLVMSTRNSEVSNIPSKREKSTLYKSSPLKPHFLYNEGGLKYLVRMCGRMVERKLCVSFGPSRAIFFAAKVIFCFPLLTYVRGTVVIRLTCVKVF